MLINVLHLFWICPASFILGASFVLVVFLVATMEDRVEELEEMLDDDFDED